MKCKELLLFVIAIGLIGCGSESHYRDTVQEAKEEFQVEVELSNDCTDTSECTIVHTDCPLGCGTAVNVNHADRVEAKAQELTDSVNSGAISCENSCAQAVAQCIDRKCEAILNL